MLAASRAKRAQWGRRLSRPGKSLVSVGPKLSRRECHVCQNRTAIACVRRWDFFESTASCSHPIGAGRMTTSRDDWVSATGQEVHADCGKSPGLPQACHQCILPSPPGGTQSLKSMLMDGCKSLQIQFLRYIPGHQREQRGVMGIAGNFSKPVPKLTKSLSNWLFGDHVRLTLRRAPRRVN